MLTSTRTSEKVLKRLLDWALNAVETAANQPILPHAIIVYNAIDHEIPDERWDPDVSTAFVMDTLASCITSTELKKYLDFWNSRGQRVEDLRQLLESFYASISVVLIPNGKSPNLLAKQVGKLHALIKHQSDLARIRRLELRMLLDSEDFEAHMSDAFDHFARRLDVPFDFVGASFRHNPIPNTFAGNIVKLASQAVKRLQTPLPGAVIFEELSYLIASCIMLDAARHKIKGM